MSSLDHIEKRYFEDLLDLSSGYVLDYSNATFAEFFRRCVNIDIYADKYSFNGESKAKRLRSFWEIEPDMIVGKVLEALLDVWRYKNKKPDDQNQKRHEKAIEIAYRLQGKKIISNELDESTFLRKQFKSLDVNKIGLDVSLLSVIENRLQEAQKCMVANAPLSVIFLSGSILEGILLSVASQNPKTFNQAKAAPKNEAGKVRAFHDWSLAQLIDVAHETGFIKLDVKKFSHELRDFRNYIHPFQQSYSGFQPTRHTAEICFQVLKAAIAYLSGDDK
jgi:hypothetical protein